ncbi:hypothetical protein [Chryseobacterium sp.]|uniref:hypothetical protein n=1 Tax=Chryseobacterium sp. TaxID=1871047 RepID=UPI000EE63FAE|nr:hypothetical protein [Chryseobacterium sp.]HCA09409.1 hypothetical protein [Chryseobacterium sp.]
MLIEFRQTNNVPISVNFNHICSFESHPKGGTIIRTIDGFSFVAADPYNLVGNKILNMIKPRPRSKATDETKKSKA